jgi:hypothetical protein
MIRWIVFVLMLLTGCVAAQIVGGPAQDQPAVQDQNSQNQPSQSQPSQSQPSEQPPAAQSGASSLAASPSKSGFPLDEFQEFSAIMVGSMLSGDERESHIYRSGKLLRTQGTEGLGYYLTDLASFETYALTRLGCISDSHPFFRAFPFTAGRPGRKFERVAGAKESVDGHMCQVEDITISGHDLPLPIRLKFWEAEDLHGFPVKVQVLNGGGKGIIRYKDVVLGPVDPSLFVRPEQCAAALPQPPDKKPAPKKKPAAAPAGNSQP